ncbi:carbohydrate sulfotransferase 1-like [Styela clava]
MVELSWNQAGNFDMTICRILMKRRFFTGMVVFTSIILISFIIFAPRSINIPVMLKEERIGNQENLIEIEKGRILVETQSKVPLPTSTQKRKIQFQTEASKIKNESIAKTMQDISKKITVPPKVVVRKPEVHKLPNNNVIPMLKIQPGAPRRYIHDVQGYQKYVEYLKMTELLLPKQTNAVVILTNHRSGSSFFGELFNQHPDVFYVFEPIFPFSNSSECKMASLKKKVLANIAQCVFPNWAEIYKSIPVSDYLKNNHNMKFCLAHRVCFRVNTKELIEEKHCPNVNRAKYLSADCGAVNINLAMNDCRRKKMVVFKVIRLCDILNLEEIMKLPTHNVKVLHLIRDPRGIANSRKPLLKGIDMKESLRSTCARQSHNMMMGLFDTPEWLQGRYKAVRYEDAALYPYDIAQSVYDFLGLDFYKSLKDWIKKNTNIEIPSEILEETPSVSKRDVDPKQQAHLLRGRINLVKKPKVIFNPYGRKRNSTAIVQKWTNLLPYTTVQQIESVCTKIMDLAGYLPVGSSENYQNKDNRYFTDEIRDFDALNNV